MANFFLRDGDEQRAQQAVFMDDIDLVYSDKESTSMGPRLVAVAVRNIDGCQVHICQICGNPFDESEKHLRSSEVHMGNAIMKLHTQCSNGSRPKSFRSFADVVRGMQSRRFYAEATQPFARTERK